MAWLLEALVLLALLLCSGEPQRDTECLSHEVQDGEACVLSWSPGSLRASPPAWGLDREKGLAVQRAEADNRDGPVLHLSRVHAVSKGPVSSPSGLGPVL